MKKLLSIKNVFLIFSGSNPRAIIAFCRKLYELNLPFIIIARTQKDFIFKTKYKKFVYAIRTRDELNLEEILNYISRIKHENGINKFVICPTSEYFNIFLLENRNSFRELNCEIPLVDYSKYKTISDKKTSSALVESYGVRIPKRINYHVFTGYPIVAKPYSNVNKNKKSLYPYLIFDQDDLKTFNEKEVVDDFYFEEFINGLSFYLLYYISKSGKIYKFSQQNLAQQANGKSMILAKSANIHEEPISEKFEEILLDVNFFGFAMVDLIYDQQSNEYVFIEINPRFWGPFQLTSDGKGLLMEAFIHDYFPEQFQMQENISSTRKKQATYIWVGGFLENLLSRQKVKWYIENKKIKAILKSLCSDIYLRKDTIKLFWNEICKSLPL